MTKLTRRRGFIDARTVRAITFFATCLSLIVAVVASLLAIWKFTGTDVLWRTVATCAVVGGGSVAFYWVNALFGEND
ncbi:MAG TPA: hypothetical protein VLK65_05905 [Vicinamibacteria bacterium]|nr:hypothetical protein [Vicinamibacteria bacterium]